MTDDAEHADEIRLRGTRHERDATNGNVVLGDASTSPSSSAA